MTELDGVVEQVIYKNGSWWMRVELRQPLVESQFLILGTVEIHIDAKDAATLTTSSNPKIKLLVEIATQK